MNRKEFVRNTTLAAGAIMLQSAPIFARSLNSQLKVAMIGTGLRGQDHLDLLLRRKDVRVAAICDIDARMLTAAREIIEKAGAPQATVYTGSDMAWHEMLQKEKPDLVVISTPWEWHTPMILGALEAGVRYVGTEVVLGITLKDHWKVVKAAEKYRAHVMMLENVCYRRDVMAILNMVRKGMFGEIIHLQGGYQHDLREVKFNDGIHPYGHGVLFGPEAYSEARWRTAHSVTRNGDLYPTHGIGPLAHYININRGNRFVSLCSFASKARGLHEYIVEKGGKDHPNAQVRFQLGDVVTTNIQCANGETILLQHDTSLPRPYSLGFRVQGTKGLWMDLHKSIYIEGQSAKSHQWDPQKEWLEKYDHPLWARWSRETAGSRTRRYGFFCDPCIGGGSKAQCAYAYGCV